MNKDIKKALIYFDKSTTIKESCNKLYELYKEGDEVKQNKIKAKAYLRKEPILSIAGIFLQYTCNKLLK